MTIAEATASYAALSPTNQLRFLARYAHWVTIVGRGTYIPNAPDVADPRRLRALNEVQHRVAGFISSLAEGKQPWCDHEIVV